MKEMGSKRLKHVAVTAGLPALMAAATGRMRTCAVEAGGEGGGGGGGW